MKRFLSRPALKRTVQSLLVGELDAIRGKRSALPNTTALIEHWPDDLSLGNADGLALGCDSLEVLHLSAAVNEMFHLHEVGLETQLLGTQMFGTWLTIIEDAWTRGVNRITLTTSGSTGVPKRCTHTFTHLATEIDCLAEMFRDRTRILALAPAKHIYGLLFTALLPDRLGIPLLDLSASSSVVRNQASRTFQQGDLVVSVPNVWAWLDRSISHWEQGIAGVTSTAPSSTTTLSSLSSKGMSKMFEVYGATETAGIGVRVWPEPFYSLMPHWTHPLDHALSATLVSEQSAFEVVPMDDLRFIDERHFQIRGRSDGAVQVGGRNVFLSHIEQRLVAHSGIKTVAVRLMRPEEGDRLKCFIVPEGDSRPEHLQQSIEAFLSTWLDPVECPKLFAFGSELPKNEQGKLCDW